MRNETLLDGLLQLPNDILEEYKESKFPLFIKRFLMRRDIKKAMRIITKFREANIIVDKVMLDQYLNIIMNDIQPEHSYGCITEVKSNVVKSTMYPSYSFITALVDMKEFKARINSNRKERAFEVVLLIKMIDDDKSMSYNFIDEKMRAADSSDYYIFINKINKQLVVDIANYFTEYLETSVKESTIYKGEKV